MAATPTTPPPSAVSTPPPSPSATTVPASTAGAAPKPGATPKPSATTTSSATPKATVTAKPTPTKAQTASATPHVASTDSTNPTASVTLDGPAATLATTAAGQHAVFQFSGSAGQRVFVTITTVGATDSATGQLLSPTGAVLATSSYMSSFPGSTATVNTTALSTTGSYSVSIAPSGTGTYQVQVATVPADQSVAGTVGGAAIPLTFGKAGQNATITFPGNAGGRLFTLVTVNSSSDPSSYTSFSTTLLAPDGSQVGSAYNYSGTGGIDAVTLPATGSYKVLVDPQGSLTGAVTVQLFAVAADATVAAPVLGTAYQGAVGYGQNIGFTFHGTAGQKISGQASIASANGSALTSWFLAPDGSYGYSGDTTLTATLTLTGNYTFYIDPSGAESGTVTATISVPPSNVTATAVVGGPAVTVNTTSPGQQADVTFSGTAGQQVLITCAVNLANTGGNSYTGFTLTDPSGGTVSSSYYCSTPILFDRQTLSRTGNYQLAIVPPSTATGSITIQAYLVPADVTATATLDGPAVPVTVTAPGQGAVIGFQATAGQRVYFTCTATSLTPSTGVIDARRYDPSGTTVGYIDSCGAHDFLDTETVGGTGLSTVRITPTGLTTGSVTIQAHSVPADATAVATPGGPAVTVTTTVPGQKADISFTATANMRVYVACVASLPETSNHSQVQYYLSDPSGSQLDYGPGVCAPVPARHLVSTLYDTRTLTAAGVYTIAIDPPSTETGSITLQVYSVPADPTTAATIGGATATVTTTAVGQKPSFTFTATPNQRVYVSGSQSLVNANGNYSYYSMSDATQTFYAGSAFFSPPTVFDTQVLPIGGTYTIAISPPSNATGTYSIRIYSVPADPSATLTPGGAPATLTTTVPGQRMSATFTASANQRVFISCTPAMTGMGTAKSSIVLTGPSGSAVGSPADCSKAPLLFDSQILAAAGTYIISVDPPGIATGSFTLQVYSVPPDVTATAVVGGAPVTLTTTVAGQKMHTAFTATANQRIFVSCTPAFASNPNGASPSATLTGPSGAQVGSTGDCGNEPILFDSQVLPSSGSYTINVSPPGVATGSFTVRVYEVPADVTATATVGGPAATVTTTAVGQKSSITFTVTANQRIYLSCSQNLVDTNYGFTTFLLMDPDGNQIGFGLCDTPPLLFDSQVLSTPGTYTITINPPGTATGSVSIGAFSVPDDVSATATVGGPPVTVSTTAVGQKASITFAGTAGQTVTAVASASRYPDGASVQLLDPDGNQVWSDVVSGTDPLTDSAVLPTTGTYTILVSPTGTDTGGLVYTLS